mgnify:CR=1 FL=1
MTTATLQLSASAGRAARLWHHGVVDGAALLLYNDVRRRILTYVRG